MRRKRALQRRHVGAATFESEGGKFSPILILHVHHSMSKPSLVRVAPCKCGQHPEPSRLDLGGFGLIARRSVDLSGVRQALLLHGEGSLAERLLRPATAEEAREIGKELGRVYDRWFLASFEGMEEKEALAFEFHCGTLRWISRWYLMVGSQDFGVQVEE